MDCNSKALSKTFFVLLILPTLIWGYSKAVIRLAQNGVSPTLGQFGDRSPEDKSESKKSNKGKGDHSKLGAENSLEGLGTQVSTPVVERDSLSPAGAFEPEAPVGSYNQIQAKKPSIPARFDGTNAANFQSEENQAFGGVSILKLLGIPTLIFGALFFVMWGIISGKIQRIMV